MHHIKKMKQASEETIVNRLVQRIDVSLEQRAASQSSPSEFAEDEATVVTAIPNSENQEEPSTQNEEEEKSQDQNQRSWLLLVFLLLVLGLGLLIGSSL